MQPKYPAGYYAAEVRDINVEDSKPNQDGITKKMIVLRIQILGELSDPFGDASDYYPGGDEDFRLIFLVIGDERSQDFIAKKLQNAGFDGQSLTEALEFFPGKIVKVHCKHDVYQGKTREKWDLPLPMRERVLADDSELRTLDSLFERAFTRNKPAFQAPAPPRSNHGGGSAPPPAGDDEIPFGWGWLMVGPAAMLARLVIGA